MADQIMKKLEEHDKRFDENEKKSDRIAKAVVENKERLDRVEENMVTKEDHQEVMSTLDEIVGLVKKKDEEMIFMRR